MRFAVLTTMNWRLLTSRISHRAIWLTEINASWVKMEALGSSESFASLHGIISHNTENIQTATVNLNSNKSIGLRRGEGLSLLCEVGTEFLYIIYMNFKLHRPRHDSDS